MITKSAPTVQGFHFYLQEKHVNTVAVGIGPGVNKEILHQIAGPGNPVVQVNDFSQLHKMLETIKGSACSGGFSNKPDKQLHW